jgi:hypothetical protein
MSLFDLSDLERGPGAALLRQTCAMGFSEPVARLGLQAEFEAWQVPGAVDQVLEEVVGVDPGRIPREVLIIGAATLPVSTLRACLMARLLGAQVRLKTASGLEGLAQAISQSDPGVISDCFSSTDQAALDRALESADTVVALGSDATLAAIGERLATRHTFVGYGHRVSAAHLQDPEDHELTALAHDLLAWDGQGCLSPSVIWTNHDLEDTAQTLLKELERLEAELPFTPSAEMAHARYVAEALGAMGGAVLGGATTRLILKDEPTFIPSPASRVVHVLPDRGAPWRDLGVSLSTLGCSEASEAAPAHDTARRCALGQMQRPVLDWPHDGRPNLLPMLGPERAPSD